MGIYFYHINKFSVLKKDRVSVWLGVGGISQSNPKCAGLVS